MNTLYIIGNGFDLAHQLPTSYNEFIFDFFRKSIHTIKPSRIYNVGPLVIYNQHNVRCHEKLETLKELLEYCKTNNITIDYKNSFFRDIVEDYSDKRWVDIEYAYYQKILHIIHGIKNYISTPEHVIALNTELYEIKSMLISYLKSLDFNNIKIFESIKSHIRPLPDPVNDHNLFLNFNYTSLIAKYIDTSRGDEVINIHGSLDDAIEDIVFGYGDEMDDMYQEIEKLNNNAFLDNFKSFGYLKRSYYQKLQTFLERDFEVIIMGHSCGISDRVLLNAIFTNENCKKIHICYYAKSDLKNDFFEKTQEISRHFGKSNKEEMRLKIVPFDQSKPLIPYTHN